MWIFSPKWWRDRALRKAQPERSKMFGSGSVIRAKRGAPNRTNKAWILIVDRVDKAPLKLLTDYGIIWYNVDGSRVHSLPEDIKAAWNYMENNGVNKYDKEKIISEALAAEKDSNGSEFLEFELYCVFLPEHPKSIYAGFALEDDCMAFLTKINKFRQEQSEELAYWKRQKVRYMFTTEHI